MNKARIRRLERCFGRPAAPPEPVFLEQRPGEPTSEFEARIAEVEKSLPPAPPGFVRLFVIYQPKQPI